MTGQMLTLDAQPESTYVPTQMSWSYRLPATGNSGTDLNPAPRPSVLLSIKFCVHHFRKEFRNCRSWSTIYSRYDHSKVLCN